MKRILPLTLALLLLAACGAPALPPSASPTEAPATPSPIVTPSPQPAPVSTPEPPPELILSRPIPGNLALPSTGFEPESYWIADDFSYRGQALLILSGDGRFKCWYNYYEEVPDTVSGSEYKLYLESLTEDGGEASANGDTLTLKLYEDTGTAPETFRKAEYGEALTFWRDMPLNDEVQLPLPPDTTVEELAALGAGQLDETTWLYNGLRVEFEADGYGGSRIHSYCTYERDTGLSVRGADIGDYIDFVKQRFPESDGYVLYGSISGVGGSAAYSDQGHSVLVYEDNSVTLRFLFSYGGWLTCIDIFPKWP